MAHVIGSFELLSSTSHQLPTEAEGKSRLSDKFRRRGTTTDQGYRAQMIRLTLPFGRGVLEGKRVLLCRVGQIDTPQKPHSTMRVYFWPGADQPVVLTR